jgi:hypothetical protein
MISKSADPGEAWRQSSRKRISAASLTLCHAGGIHGGTGKHKPSILRLLSGTGKRPLMQANEDILNLDAVMPDSAPVSALDCGYRNRRSFALLLIEDS